MIKKRSIKVISPASVSNVGPGFDILGFPLDVNSDIIELKITDKKELRITEILPTELGISKDPVKNTAGKSLAEMMNAIKFPYGIELKITKEIGIGTGLGSSAASAVGAVYAFNQLLENPLEVNELIKFALAGEAVASGSIHGDNVIPCMLGGFILVRNAEELEYTKIDFPDNLICLVIKPDVVINTKAAREVLPKEYSRNILTEQSVNIASLISGLMKGDYDLIKKSVKDKVAEPYRKKLIPFYDEIKNLVELSDSYGFSISGSGPTLFAFYKDQDLAHKIGLNAVSFYNSKNIKSDYYVSKINITGPKVIP